jgi:succinate dehydrogenase / fumarate reductase cytochrome b subunit
MHTVNGVMKDKRPVYLNLFKICLPIAGMVSLAHRVSGVLLFIAIPFTVYLLDLSVISADGFGKVMAILQHPLVLLIEAVLVWALAHHFFAGIRFLLIDADIGVDKIQAKYGAWLVVVAEVLVVGVFIRELIR